MTVLATGSLCSGKGLGQGPQNIITELDAVARERKRTRAEIIREAVDIYLGQAVGGRYPAHAQRQPRHP